ncbi:MAG: tautomerase family protein [Candidatus Altiarchaeota archaeon]
MPVVTVESWPMGESRRSELIKGITGVFTSQGIPPEAVTVILHESPMENWGTGGEQHSVKFKDLVRR